MSTPHQPKRDRSKALALLGTIVAGRYRVLELLGQGGFGTVYLVEAVSGMIGNKLALKLLPAEMSRDEKGKARFLNEIDVAMRMVHKYIVQIRDVGETENGQLYYTMDHCPGENLAAVLKREGKLPPERALPIALRMLEGLKTAHAGGVIHRDLKPANVMVFPKKGRESVRILDFGIATAIKREEDEHDPAGSVHYMPPEQFKNEQLGFYTDTYAVGVILYEALTGQRPHRGKNARELYEDKQSRPVTPPEEVNPGLSAYPGLSRVISKSLERNPLLRYQTARDLFEELQGVIEAGAKPAIVPPRPAATARPAAIPSRPASSSPPVSRFTAVPDQGSPMKAEVPDPFRVYRREHAREAAKRKGERRRATVPLVAALAIVALLGWVAWKTIPRGEVDGDAKKAVKAEKRKAPRQEGDSLLERVRQAREDGRWAEVLKLASRSAERDPTDSEAHWLRGEAELRLGRNEAALRSFLAASRTLPPTNDWRRHLMVVEAYNGALSGPGTGAAGGRLDQELEDLDAAARAQLARRHANQTIAVPFLELLEKRGAKEELVSVLKSAMRTGIADPTVRRLEAEHVVKPRVEHGTRLLDETRRAVEGGRFDQGIEKADLAIAFDPPPELPRYEAEAYLLRGTAQLERGAHEAGLESLTLAWDSTPPGEKVDSRLPLLLIRAYAGLKSPREEARKAFERAFQALGREHLEPASLTRALESLDQQGSEAIAARLVRLARGLGIDLPVLKRLHQKILVDLPAQRSVEAEKHAAECQKALRNMDLDEAAAAARRGIALMPPEELGLPLEEVYIKLELLLARALLQTPGLLKAPGLLKDGTAAEEVRSRLGRLRERVQDPGARAPIEILEALALLPVARGPVERAALKVPMDKLEAAATELKTGGRGQKRELLAEAHSYLARCHALLGEWPQVDEDILTAIRTRDGDPALIYHQAVTYYLAASREAGPDRSAAYEKAKRRFSVLYSDHRDTPFARRNLEGHYLMGLCYSRLNDPVPATQCFVRAEPGMKERPELYEAWGDAHSLYASINNESPRAHAEAGPKYKRCFEIKPELKVLRKWASSVEKAGHRKQAQRILDEGMMKIKGK